MTEINFLRRIQGGSFTDENLNLGGHQRFIQ